MPRRSTGGVVIDARRKSPVFALRFRAYGRRQYLTLGSAEQGWTPESAEAQLRHVLADVERGIWKPPDREPRPAPEPAKDPTFHEFASDWFRANEGGWRPTTVADYQWQLSSHLLPFFAGHRLSQISIAEVDRYRAAKVRERVLSATSINKTITRLAQILEVAVEYEMIVRNPAIGKRRRVKASKPHRSYLDSAEQIGALLAAAGDLDALARRNRQHVHRRALLGVLVFAGLRIGELLDLRWRDVDLAGGRLRVGEAKTDAGRRHVTLRPALYDLLAAMKADAGYGGPDVRVFATATGARQGATNIRRRVLAPAVQRANQRLLGAGSAPLPDRLTPHSLRRTFASVLYAVGEDPPTVMAEMGHTTPGLALAIYAHAMRRDEHSRRALRELVGLSGQHSGSNGVPGEFPMPASGRRA